jgi:hypothetical protein
VLEVAVTNGSSADNEGAVGHGLGNGAEFLGIRQNLSAANRGTRLAKGAFEWIHHSQVRASEVAHSAGGGADV